MRAKPGVRAVWFRSLLLLAVVSLSFIPVQAQSTSTPVAFLYPLESSAFPLISSLLDVFDRDGQFLSGLQKGDVAILENGQARPLESLEEQGRPLQLVVAINPGPALGMRDPQGVTRFEKVAGALQSWAQSRPIASEDRLSLVSIGGIIIGQATYQDWANALSAFRPNFLRTTPNLQTLNLAFETLAQHPSLPGGKRAILFITPHMDQPGMELTLKPFAERAHQEGVRVYVWVVDAEAYFTHSSTQAFQVLAFETGGKSFLFSGKETLPDPESYFEPLRHVYVLTYRSQVNRSGAHAVRLQVQQGTSTILSNEQSFTIDLQPPQPMLFVPSWQVIRQPSPEDPWNEEALLPEEQVLEASVSFPDGHPRPIQAVRLYVDGQMVAENLAENGQPPSMQFRWDLRPYRLSAQHYLVVEVVDSLGLIGQTQALPVTVTVILPPRGWRAFLMRYNLQLTIGFALLAFLLTIWVFVGARLQTARNTRRLAQSRALDPLTQPVEISPRPSRGSSSKVPVPETFQEEPLQTLNVEAYLLRLSAQGQPLGTALPLRAKDLIFGSDPRQVNVILHDSSVSAVHARLRRTEEGYRLFDLGSVAGTWVNYEPVPQEGKLLQPGDRIHFGRLIYRFERPDAPPPPEPVILLLDEKQT
ncbi:MAG: FHA domain-containing protein [Anaerolineales bacterium]